MKRNARKILSIMMSMVVIVTAFTIIFPTNTTAAKTIWYVDDVQGGWPPEDFTSIQEAVDSLFVLPGDTIFVYSGVYNEDVEVDKALTITGEDTFTTTIIGQTNTMTIYVTADNVEFSGFTVKKPNGYTGVLIESADNCTIKKNNIMNFYQGVYVVTSNNSIIIDNTISAMNLGIYIYGQYGYYECTIQKNYVSSNYMGLHLYDIENSTVNGNVIDIGYQGVYSVRIEWSTLVTVFKNIISTNSNKFNVFLTRSTSCALESNTLNGAGVSIYGWTYTHYTSHSMTNNTVNNKPLVYWKNVSGGTVPSGAGQIILVECQYILVTGQKMSKCSIGVYGILSNEFTIRDNTIVDSPIGILLERVPNTAIYNNNIITCVSPISLVSSEKCKIFDNTISGIMGGIYLENSDRSDIMYNQIIIDNPNGNNYGSIIQISYSPGCDIRVNTLFVLYPTYLRGISVVGSSNTSVSGNDISANYKLITGVSVTESVNVTVIENVISDCQEGIYLEGSYCHVNSNKMYGCGVIILGYDNSDYWITHTMDDFNTVNDKPLIYWKGVVNDTVPLGAGEVILVMCENVTVSKQKLDDTTISVELIYSTKCAIYENRALSTYYGFYLYKSENCTIAKNDLSGSPQSYAGILIRSSNSNDVIGNRLSNYNLYGIQLIYSQRNAIRENTISNCDKGVYLSGLTATQSSENRIYRNYATGNGVGYNLNAHATNNQVYENTAYQNTYGILLGSYSGSSNGITDNQIQRNNIMENTNGIQIGYDCSRTDINYNNLIDNGIQAYDFEPLANDWNYNYWSDYEGMDWDGDGYGDTNIPHPSLGYDMHPHMNPYHMFRIVFPQLIEVLIEDIQELPDESFKKKPEQRKNAILNKLDAVENQIADENYQGAINKLRNDIRAKMDGSVDGNPKNDWIMDLEAQYELTTRIDELISALQLAL